MDNELLTDFDSKDEFDRCERCGKVLTNNESKILGKGAVCRCKDPVSPTQKKIAINPNFKDIRITPDLEGDEDWEMGACRSMTRQVMGIFEGNEIVGYIQYGYFWDDEEEKGIYNIYRAEILPKFRGKGYFSRAVDYMIEEFDNCDEFGLMNVRNKRIIETFDKKDIPYHEGET